MIIKLTKLRFESGGCPTSYSGETNTGQIFKAYLRNGYMNVTINGQSIVDTNPKNLDGVCSFSDFKHYAIINGFIIDDSEAEQSSSYDDLENYFTEFYEKNHRVEFIKDFHSKAAKETYYKGKTYTAEKELAKLLVETGLAKIIR